MEYSVGFIDSGVGGLAYYNEFKKALSSNTAAADIWKSDTPSVSTVESCNIKYLADNINFPYGNKSEEFITKRVCDLIPRFIQEYQLGLLVIACNTMSLIALEEVRKIVHIPIIGVVPAIKPAFEKKYSRVYVMNTSVSSQAQYAKNMTQSLNNQFGNQTQIFLRSCQSLVSAIEDMLMNEDSAYHGHMVAELSQIVYEIHELEAQAVVLGCTHFLHVKKELQRLLHPHIHIVDSLEGVVNRSLWMMKKSFKELQYTKSPSLDIVSTLLCTDEKRLEQYASISTLYDMPAPQHFT